MSAPRSPGRHMQLSYLQLSYLQLSYLALTTQLPGPAAVGCCTL